MEKKAYIYLWEGRFLYIGGKIRTRNHAHHAVQIGISFDHPFRMKVGDNHWLDSHGIIIAPDRNHECDVPDISVAYLSLDPEALLAKKMQETWIKNKAFEFLPDEQTTRFADQIKNCLNSPHEINAINLVVDDFLNSLVHSTSFSPIKHSEPDERIASVIKILKGSNGRNVLLHEVVDRIGLSGSRLVHLFKQEVGIPMRRYMLWLRLNKAIQEILRDHNLTEAAIHAGFSDSAHFSRTFFRNFGISPSDLIKNSQIIQAFHANPH